MEFERHRIPYHNMTVPTLDFTKALVNELKTLRDRYIQFQTRVKVANSSARARDEDARRQNAILAEKISVLESELKVAKESIEVYASYKRMRTAES